MPLESRVTGMFFKKERHYFGGLERSPTSLPSIGGLSFSKTSKGTIIYICWYMCHAM